MPIHSGCFVCGNDTVEILTSKTVNVTNLKGRPDMPRNVGLCPKCFPVTETVDLRETVGK